LSEVAGPRLIRLNANSPDKYHFFSNSNSSLQQLTRAIGVRKGENRNMCEIVEIPGGWR
jgi:hypothetical protein